MSESAQQAVITAIGIVSPIGIGWDSFEAALRAGKSGIAPITLLPASAIPGNLGGEVRELTEETAKSKWLKSQRKNLKVMSREIQLAATSAIVAIEQSGLKVPDLAHERVGVEFGSNQMFSPPDMLQDSAFACIEEGAGFHAERWGDNGLGKMYPLWLLKYLPNMPSCHISILADARGPSNSLTMNEASGNLSIGEAIRVMRRGQADIMITGASGTRTACINSMHSRLYDELANFPGEPPETWSRPFDATRNGQVLGEGAATIILETKANADARSAKIFGTILGTGSSCVLQRDGQPNFRLALVNAAKAAFHDAGIGPDDVGHVNAFGLSTKSSDAAEAAAIHDIFGSRGESIPVTAFKSYLGNSGAGSGPLELAASLVGLRTGEVFPTLNYRNPDPDCRLNVVHGTSAKVTTKVFLKLSVTSAGQASALLAAGV